MRQSQYDRIVKAISQDPSVLADAETIKTHPGKCTAEMLLLGFRESDLKKLETMKMAIRGRCPSQLHGGHEIRWVIIDLEGIFT